MNDIDFEQLVRMFSAWVASRLQGPEAYQTATGLVEKAKLIEKYVKGESSSMTEKEVP